MQSLQAAAAARVLHLQHRRVLLQVLLARRRLQHRPLRLMQLTLHLGLTGLLAAHQLLVRGAPCSCPSKAQLHWQRGRARLLCRHRGGTRQLLLSPRRPQLLLPELLLVALGPVLCTCSCQ